MLSSPRDTDGEIGEDRPEEVAPRLVQMTSRWVYESEREHPSRGNSLREVWHQGWM